MTKNVQPLDRSVWLVPFSGGMLVSGRPSLPGSPLLEISIRLLMLKSLKQRNTRLCVSAPEDVKNVNIKD